MKKKRNLFILLYLSIILMCASCHKTENKEVVQSEAAAQSEETAQSEVAAEKDSSFQEQSESDTSKESESIPEQQGDENEKEFYKQAEEQGIDRQTAKDCLQILLDDNLFNDGEMMLTGLRIDDIDGNGQTDMLVRVVDAQEKPFYGSGGLWFYMNEDDPYCFCDEEFPYYGDYDLFWEDIDNDENVEIVFWSQGIGVGATGDIYNAVFKYKNHTIEQMRLPSDLEYGDGIFVEVIQEAEADSYTAYCPYFDERIPFHAENIEGKDLPSTAQSVGENVRGFCDLRVAEYQGKNALQASEYLKGEGAVPHNVATAQFLITWKEDGMPEVVQWWIEEHKNIWANMHESRVNYMDGYYYYASQSDHYYLYRVKEDGSNPQCLAKVHASDICVQDGEIYFVNQSDGHGIYRMKADGSEMKKLCEYGRDLQISAEYVFFYSIYDEEYITAGITDRFLYRMKKDGSEKVQIDKDVSEYVLSDGYSQEIRYAGAIYCGKSKDGGMTVYKMGMNGQNAKEVCHFDTSGKMAVYGRNIYCASYSYGEREKIMQFCLDNGEMTSLAVPKYTDCCFYKGYFYGLCEQGEEQQKISLYRVDLNSGDIEILYEDTFSCSQSYGVVSDIYATEQGIFFRRFVSEQEGCRWFRLTANGDVQEWEDREKIPVALPAREKEYGGDYLSVLFGLESTQGYETYLAEDLEYEEYFFVDEDGTGRNSYRICLPQFNIRIAGYKKINQYLQNAYQDALQKKEDFFEILEKEDPQESRNWYEYTHYCYVYIGEQYITVVKYEGGYTGGIRSYQTPKPVTFNRASGEVVSLETILGMTTQEAVAALTGAVYKYMEGIGRGTFFLKAVDELTKEYNPEQFFLFPDGIGIYYEIYAIDCGAAGDYLFIVPWEDLGSGCLYGCIGTQLE